MPRLRSRLVSTKVTAGFVPCTGRSDWLFWESASNRTSRNRNDRKWRRWPMLNAAFIVGTALSHGKRRRSQGVPLRTAWYRRSLVP